MPAAAPAVEKRQGLNQVMINKVQKMIEGKQRDVMGTITRLLEEGKAAQDFIAPIGTGRRNSGRKPVISFHAADRVQMAMPEGGLQPPRQRHQPDFRKKWVYRPNTSGNCPLGTHGRNNCAPQYSMNIPTGRNVPAYSSGP